MKSELDQNMVFNLQDGDLVVRPLIDRPADYLILTNWLQNKRILEFYEGRDQVFSLASVQEKYSPNAMIKDGKTPCLIEFLQRPVGYLQFCALKPEQYTEYDFPESEIIYGMDLFIGEVQLWGCGLGRRALSCTLNYLFSELGADRVVLDPHIDNLRAIRSYTAAGFQKVKLLPQHECHEGHWKDCWLMEAKREQSL
jgi:aminoglycoside 6'-N-acetyltransferase